MIVSCILEIAQGSCVIKCHWIMSSIVMIRDNVALDGLLDHSFSCMGNLIVSEQSQWLTSTWWTVHRDLLRAWV